MAEWMKLKEDHSGDTRAQGRVDYDETDMKNYSFTVHVWTRVSGRLETGNGTATYIMFGEGDKIISSIQVAEYASTDALHTSDEDHNSEGRRYLRSYFDANVVSDALIVNAHQVSNTPDNIGEVFNWLKDMGGEIFSQLREEALKEGKGAIREGANFIIRVLK